MRVPRLYLDQPLALQQAVLLDKEASHYLTRVLRLRERAKVILFNGAGGEYLATLTATAPNATLLPEYFTEPLSESPLILHLAQGISRGERMHYAIQKAVELGVSTIQPIVSRYCEVKLDQERSSKRQLHWQGVAKSAAEQSGRTQLTPILPAVKLADWLTQTAPSPDHIGLVLDPRSTTRLSQLPAEPPCEVTLLIGPEGGLDETEIDNAVQAGFSTIQLGPRVLRTETAAVCALAAINLMWGDFR